MQIFNSFTPEAIEILKNGGVGVIPTDTIYGIVCQLSNQAALERLYDLKDRAPDQKAGTTLISNVEQIEDYVDPEELLRAQVLWPAPISIEMKVNGLHYAHRGFGTLAFRMPNDEQLLSVINQTGPLATSSANISGKPAAVTVQEALSYFRGGLDFYVDGGELSHRTASQVVRFKDDGEVEVIRKGGNK